MKLNKLGEGERGGWGYMEPWLAVLKKIKEPIIEPTLDRWFFEETHWVFEVTSQPWWMKVLLIQPGPSRAFLVQGVPNGHSPTVRERTCKFFTKKLNLRDEVKEQNNQSHPPFSVQVTSQRGCHFTPAAVK
jgi:hypothetical protein